MAVLLTINGTAAQGLRLGNALADKWGYSPLLEDGITPNPETKLEFIKGYLIRWLISEAAQHEATVAAEVTREQKAENFRTDVILT